MMIDKSILRSTTLLLIFFAACRVANGQEIDPLETTIQANQLSDASKKLGVVDPGSGILNVTIPLINARSGSMNIPIGISFNAQGRRYNEKASWVGYGWSLDYGGKLNRQVNGLPDDIPLEDFSGNFSHVRGYLNHSLTNADLPEDGQHPEYQNAGYGTMDYQPDYFRYSILGSTGQFALERGSDPCSGDVVGSAIELPKSTNTISTDYSTAPNEGDYQDWECFDFHLSLNAFQIENQSGIKYTFEQGNRTRFESGNSSRCGSLPLCQYEYFNSWNLSQIKDVYDVVCATYNYSSNFINSSNEYQNQSKTVFYNNSNFNSSSSQTDKLINSVKYIESIDLINGYVVDFTRTTLSSGQIYLTEIKYSDGNDLITRVDLNYDHSDPDQSILTSVTYYNSHLEVVDQIEFEYYDAAPLHRGPDHWGFFTYSPSSNRIPAIQYIQQDVPSWAQGGTATRWPDFDYAIHKNLKSIQYKSGKKEEFVYELNDYEHIAGDNFSYQVETITYHSNEYTRNYDYFASTGTNGNYAWKQINQSPDYLSIPYDQTVTYQVTTLGVSDESCSNTCDRELELQFINHPYATENIIVQGTYGEVFLPAGEYRVNGRLIEVLPPQNPTPCTPFADDCPNFYDFNFVTRSSTPGKQAGGLRLKDHIIKDQNGSEYIDRYSYQTFSNSDKSSGILLSPLKYGHQLQETITEHGTIHPYWMLLSSSMINNTFTKPGPVIYTNVKIEKLGYKSDGTEISSYGEIGSEELYFSFDNDIFTGRAYPYGPYAVPDWEIGLLEKKVIKNVSSQTVLTIISKFDYIRDDFDDEVSFGSISGTKFGLRKLNHNAPDGGVTDKYYSRDNYDLISKFFTSKRTITRENITPGSSSYLESIKEIFLTDSDILKPSKVKTTLHDGTTFIERFKYVKDYSSSPDVDDDDVQATSLRALKHSKRWAYPVEHAKFILDGSTEKLLNSSIYFYKRYYPSMKIKLSSIKTTDLAEPLAGYNMSSSEEESDTDDAIAFDYNSGLFSLSGKEVTLIDEQLDYLPNESKNKYDEFECVLTDPITRRASATITKSEYQNSRYTSFENAEYNGGWKLETTAQLNSIEEASGGNYAITGNKYYDLSQSGSLFNSHSEDLEPGQYLLSYWSTGTVNTFYGNDGFLISHKTMDEGPWTYHEKFIEFSNPYGTGTNQQNLVTIGGSGLIDELRLCELNGTMETRGYYPDGKLMYESDAMGNVVNYEYDEKGRLEWILDRERKVIENHQYSEKTTDPISFNKHKVLAAVREGMTKNEVENAEINDHDVKQVITYSDGLGRFRQRLSMNAHQSNMDRIEFAKYDPFGRQTKKYLPYFKHLLDNENYIPSAEDEQLTFYQNKLDPQRETSFPWSETELEESPLQRPVQVGGVGAEFQLDAGHSTQLEYGWNSSADNILKWTYNHQTGKAEALSTYPANSLKKTTRIDPDGNKSAVYTDNRGREVARASWAATWTETNGNMRTGWATGSNPGNMTQLVTYTVYDDFNRPVYEIPAIAIERMNGTYNLDPSVPSTIYNEFITHYVYDAFGRVIEQQNPGQGKTHYVYDQKDRLILSQDNQQRSDNKWTFTKYDTRGRVVLTGQINSTLNRDAHQNQADNSSVIEESFLAGGGVMEYTNNAFPNITDGDVFNAYYFDHYQFDVPSDFVFQNMTGISSPTEHTRGLPTGSLTRVFDGDGTQNQTLYTVSYYDNDRRTIQAFTENHKEGHDRIDTYYNNKGQVERTEQFHKYLSGSPEQKIVMRYSYTDQTGRLKNTWCKINNDPEILLSNRFYDGEGNLATLKLHRPDDVGNYLQRINYRYNDQGQLTHINNASLTADQFNPDDDDVFGQEMTYHENSLNYDPNSPVYVDLKHDGNISSMLWNAKAPEEDGTMLSKHLYAYRYDDLGQLTNAFYAADDPGLPGTFDQNQSFFDEHQSYDLGGNITSVARNNIGYSKGQPRMDDLTYNYEPNSYRIKSIEEQGLADHNSLYKHFVDGAQDNTEYTYDGVGRLVNDHNRRVRFSYNAIGLPQYVGHFDTGHHIDYTYDAAGNKLQKHVDIPPVQPCDVCDPYDVDYIGNFVYEDGELKMIYHPEGVIRPTPNSAENETDFVFDYFIKDYLGNVRAVITNEDALITAKFLASMEEVHAVIEEENFDNINETREDLPTDYPIDGSVDLNEHIAQLSSANGTEMGPSIVMEVQRGDEISLSTKYFYSEDAPGTTYDHVGILLNEVLLSLASSGSQVLGLREGNLMQIASGEVDEINHGILTLFDQNFDTTDTSHPHAYLVWMLYDQNYDLDIAGSGVAQVENPNDLETILRDGIPVNADGFLHAYVSNGSSKGVNFDNFLVQYQRGKLRQANDYYPYGLSIHGINANNDEYLNKYTSKELQTGEFDPSISTGLEMFDFHARFYDPQLGRWFTPDPAMQFSNPYLGIGNNPVMYVDPDGRLAFAFLWPIMSLGTMYFGELASNAIHGVEDASGSAWNSANSTWIGMNNALHIDLVANQNTNISIGISPLSGGIGANFSHTNGDFTFSVNASLGLGGWQAGGGVSYSSGNLTIGGGIGAGNNHWGWGLDVKMDGYGVGYYQTKYGSQTSNISGGSNPQTLGGVNLFFNDMSVRIENDFFAFRGEDRWRSNGVEISYKQYSLGTYLYNNSPGEDASDATTDDLNKQSPIHGCNRPGKNGKIYSSWKEGRTFMSPLYVGYRLGNNVYRVGYSHSVFQDATQNTIHKYFPPGRQHYFADYSMFNQGLYLFQGPYNPFSLWGR